MGLDRLRSDPISVCKRAGGGVRRIGGGGRSRAQLSVNENGSELANVRRRIDRRVGEHRVDAAASRRCNFRQCLEHKLQTRMVERQRLARPRLLSFAYGIGAIRCRQRRGCWHLITREVPVVLFP